MTTRVLIVDDHPAVREGLAIRLSSQIDMEVCGEAADVPEAMKLFCASRPDVVVVDVQLKSSNGLELIKRIASRDQSARILVWSMYPDKVYARRALQAGALGYINKEHTTDRLVEAIRSVAQGKVYLSEEMAEILLSQAVGRKMELGGSPLQSLSDRELEVFRLIGDGLSAAEIARRLHLSRHTIDTHRQRIKEKLNLGSASELTQSAVRWVVEGG